MTLHPVMAAALAPFAPARDTYRDFIISPHDWAGWQAVHVDYDGAEDANDNRAFTGGTRAEVVEQVDEWHEEQAPARPQIGLPHLVAHAYAAQLRLDDACRAGVELPGEAEFSRLEDAMIASRDQVRDVIRALGVDPEMLRVVLA